MLRRIISLILHGLVVGALVAVALMLFEVTIAPTQSITWHEVPAIAATETIMLFTLALFEGYVIVKGLKQLDREANAISAST
jgi:hypothetical protein